MAATAPRAEGPILPQKLLDEALRLKVDIAGRSEDQVRHDVREAWIEKNGLPLERYRAF